MIGWTDERLEALLTGTFTAHETDADPATARRIALTAVPSPRRWWPTAVAAAIVVLVAGLGVYVVRAADSDPPVSPAPAPYYPTGSTAAHNRDLAIAEAARGIASFPVPPGATRSETAPVKRLGHLGVYDEPVDPALTQTRWWVVPLSYDDLVAWYDAHTPANVASAYAPGDSSPGPEGDLEWRVAAHSSAYSQPAAVVSYARIGPQSTAIRTDVTLAARFDRAAKTLVPSTVTSIDITKSAIDGLDRTPTSTTVVDDRRIALITSTFNDLRGAMDGEALPCGSPVGIVYAYAVTFHWPGHTLAVDPGAPLCGVGMGLILDGTELPQQLESDHHLEAALEGSIGGS